MGVNMKFIIAGHTIELARLGGSIDNYFIKLHSAHFANQALDLSEFEKAALEFFDSHVDDYSMHDSYFNNFTVIWNSYLSARNYSQAEQIWDMAMVPAFAWEGQNQGKRIHKGTPYYFWGMTSLLAGELDKGYALMHQAVEEDVTTSGNPIPDTPAFALASLNYAKADQAFRQWVFLQMKYIDHRQNPYSAKYARTFILDDFKNKFLLSPPSIDIGFLFAFTIARLMKLSEVPPHALLSRFAGQLESNILFDLALVIDGTLKEKNQAEWKFSKHAEFLLDSVGHSLSMEQIGEINGAFRADFDQTMNDVLDGAFRLKDGTGLNNSQSDVAIAYGLRNRWAHDVTSNKSILQRFGDIEQALFNVLYMAVDHLY
jgi:hypothetical protein